MIKKINFKKGVNMSGPKYAVVTVGAGAAGLAGLLAVGVVAAAAIAAIDAIAQERERELAELKREQENLKRNLKENLKQLDNSLSEMKRIKNKISNLTKEFNSDFFIEQISEKLSFFIQQIISFDRTINIDKNELLKKIEQCKELLNQIHSEDIQQYEYKLEQWFLEQKEKRIQSDMEHFEKHEQKGYIDITFSKEENLDTYQLIAEDIEKTLLSTEFLQSDRKDFKGILNKIYELMNNNKISFNEKKEELEKLSLSYKSAKQFRYKRALEFQEFYCEYCTLTELLNYKAKEEIQFPSLESIKKEIAKLKEKISERNHLQYIAQSVDEVMEDMGLNIIDSEILIEKDSYSEHNIYQFENDGALNVYMSENGSVMMEVAITGKGKELNETEKQNAVAKMISFCSKYPEIRTKLEAKGLVFQKINNLPPIEAFAKKQDIQEIEKKSLEKATISKIRRMKNGKLHKSM